MNTSKIILLFITLTLDLVFLTNAQGPRHGLPTLKPTKDSNIKRKCIVCKESFRNLSLNENNQTIIERCNEILLSSDWCKNMVRKISESLSTMSTCVNVDICKCHQYC
ncbi:uncharacterized protein LOC136076460 [Hydra vulgaris]|uniref:Uncharacterized protein LOC136076460 n=1 Tax=Hydra vulgaris TaxID=6087 RepID=A0ABM4BAG2_HYDVU